MQRTLGFTPSKVLSGLFQLRFIAIATQLAVIAFAEAVLRMQLPLLPLLGFIAALTTWNLLVWWRLRPAILERWAPTVLEASTHLLVDVAVLSSLLYWAGGPTNPFVSLYLVPIAIAAATLPARHAWAIALACIIAYSLLLWRHIPLPHAHGHGGDDFNLHVLGMWANFIISSLLIAGFLTVLATAVRRRDQALARQREDALRTEQLLALGTQAAGTAHELNTPLSTMAILVDEMRADCPDSSKDDLDTLAGQIGLCRQRIRELVDNSQKANSSGTQTAESLLSTVIERWSLLRPETRLDLNLSRQLKSAHIVTDPTLVQALINLLTNAADASAQNAADHIGLQADIEAGRLRLFIDDHGPGLTEQQQARAGQAFFSTKSGGLGMGLVLSNATLERLGGEVILENLSAGGSRATVLIPLSTTADDA